MPLDHHNDDHILKTCGLTNSGVICYMNSFLQSLLSCTSLTRYFLSQEERFIEEENIVAIAYIKLIKNIQASEKYDAVMDSTEIFKAIVAVTKKKFPDTQFGNGQEDSGEGLHLFLDAIDDDRLYKFFMYKYVVRVWCLVCKQRVKDVPDQVDESCVLEVPLQLTGFTTNYNKMALSPINNHIRQYLSSFDEFTCPKCSQQKCCRAYQLIRAPEIITIMFNKFYAKNNIEFPSALMFPTPGNSVINYRMVAKIEHAGGRGGGHYWAHCYRRGEPGAETNDAPVPAIVDETKENLTPTEPEPEPEPEPETKARAAMYTLNDTRVGPGDTTPSKNSYIVMYHSEGYSSTGE
jgi:ubiquitin C-terminal hydrolase